MKRKRIFLPPVILDDVEQIIKATKYFKKFENKNILISGAAGFLPSYLVHALAYGNDRIFKKACKVICLDNFRTGTAERLRYWKGRSDIRFITKDITKPLKIDEHIDYIIHGASIASPVWYRKYPLETIDVNVSGTRRLLELGVSNRVSGFLYMSSSEIYGDPLNEFIPTGEDYWGNVSCTGPRACYDESKRLAETLCMIYFRDFNVPVKIVRPFNVYGPGLRLDDGRVVPDFVKNALTGNPIKVFSNGKITRSFCYVSDAAAAMLALLTNKTNGEAFNLGNTEEITIGKLAETVDLVSGNNKGVLYAENSEKAYLKDNPQRRVPDLNKIKKTINWEPQVSLIDGLKRTLEFYRDGGMR